VFKLDCALLSCLCFGFLMKYIDQTNVSAAVCTVYSRTQGHTGTDLDIYEPF
jgi:hypothetical protein